MSDRPLFSDFISGHRAGVADTDLADALRDLVDACGRTRKGGTLTLAIRVEPEGDAVSVSDKITLKLPEVADPRIYFVTPAGDLSRDNPVQPSLSRPDRDGDVPPDMERITFPGAPVKKSRVIPAGVDPETGERIDTES